MIKADWIIVHDGTKEEQAYMIECLRCGTTLKSSPPIPVDYWLKIAKAFQGAHKRCWKRGNDGKGKFDF